MLLVESPAKARKIQAYLGDSYTVRSTWGPSAILQARVLHMRYIGHYRREIPLLSEFLPNPVYANIDLFRCA